MTKEKSDRAPDSQRYASTWRTPVIALFSVYSVFIATACGSESSPPTRAVLQPAQACMAEGYSLDEGGAALRPAECMKVCNVDSDCGVVNASCPGCCDPMAIGLAYEDHYLREKTEQCRHYTGLVCGCEEALPNSRCINNLCELFKRD